MEDLLSLFAIILAFLGLFVLCYSEILTCQYQEIADILQKHPELKPCFERIYSDKKITTGEYATFNEEFYDLKKQKVKYSILNPDFKDKP